MAAKTLVSLRLPPDLVESIDTMAAHRKEDRTTLLIRMLRFAQATKAASCTHEMVTGDNRICLDCGHQFIPDPSDF